MENMKKDMHELTASGSTADEMLNAAAEATVTTVYECTASVRDGSANSNSKPSEHIDPAVMEKYMGTIIDFIDDVHVSSYRVAADEVKKALIECLDSSALAKRYIKNIAAKHSSGKLIAKIIPFETDSLYYVAHDIPEAIANMSADERESQYAFIMSTENRDVLYINGSVSGRDNIIRVADSVYNVYESWKNIQNQVNICSASSSTSAATLETVTDAQAIVLEDAYGDEDETRPIHHSAMSDVKRNAKLAKSMGNQLGKINW